MSKPNILFYFSDQQRWDTIGCYGQELDVTPNLDSLAKEGVIFEEAYTPQPLCGPCRAILQTGKYQKETGCFKDDIALPLNIKTIADYFTENNYDTAYIGKWSLASEVATKPICRDYTISAIPLERRGGYKGFWRAADILEFTSHGYDGYVFDEKMNKCEFKGYRADCITDFALEYLNSYNYEKPFFMTISHIEPHHQNDRRCYEGPKGSNERFKNFKLPIDLIALGGGNATEEYADYLGCCRSLDDNLGRVIDKLKDKGLYENTIIIYSSDYGSHFKTRNRDRNLNGADDYKRSCHSACLHVPLIISGPGFKGGKRIKELVSIASLPKTFLAMADIKAEDEIIGENLKDVVDGKFKYRSNEIFAQISESRVGRCIRTADYLYSVYAPDKNGYDFAESDIYEEDFLYDLKKDPYELNNLVKDPDYEEVREELANKLRHYIVKAGEELPEIIKAR